MTEVYVCANCDMQRVTTKFEMDYFNYGVGDDCVELSALVQVFRCPDCGERFTGEQAEAARDRSVKEHVATLGSEP